MQISFVLKDREEAGVLLAKKLKNLNLKNALVLAVPRGGVILGYKIAKGLNAELDIVTPRKLHSPNNPELAMGAVMPDGSAFLNQEVLAFGSVSSQYIEEEKKRQIKESLRRLTIYRGKRAYPTIKDKTVVLVDDGIATGATMIVAARWIKKQNSARLIIAVPVIAEIVLNDIKDEVDEIVYLSVPELFYAIGQFYEKFEQVEDSEVIKILNEYWTKPAYT